MSIHIADAYVDVNVHDQTREDVDRIMERLRSEGPVDIALRIDDQTETELRRIEARLGSLRSYDIGLRIDDRTETTLRLIETRLQSMRGTSLGLDIDNQASGTINAISAQIWAFRESVLRALRLPVTLENRTGPGMLAIFTELHQFRQMVEPLMRIPVEVRNNTTGDLSRMYTEFLAFRQLAEHTLNIPVNVHGQGMGGTSLGQTTQGFNNLGGAIKKSGEQAQQWQMIAAAVVGAFPALSVAVGGISTLAFGAVFSAIPIMAWKSNADVKAAYSDLWGDLKIGIREISPEWDKLLIGFTQRLRDTGSEWAPFWKREFAELGPAVDGFLGDVLDGVDVLNPEIDQIVKGFTAMTGSLGPQLPNILKSLVGGFAQLSAGIEENPEMFGVLLQDLADVVLGIGELGRVSMDLLPVLDLTYGMVGDLNDGLVGLAGSVDGLNTVLVPLGASTGAVGDMLKRLGGELLAFGGGPISLAIYQWRELNNTADASLPPVDQFVMATKDAVGAVIDLTQSQQDLAEEQQRGITIMDLAGMSAEDLKRKLDLLTGKTLDQRQATRDFEKAIDDLTDSYKKNGKTLDDHTAKGRANNEALDKVAIKAQKAAEAIKANGGSVEQQAQKFLDAHDIIVKYARLMGKSREEAEALSLELLGMPATKSLKLLANIGDLQSKLKTAQAELKHVPASKRAKLLGDIADLKQKIKDARAALAGLKGKDIKVGANTAPALAAAKQVAAAIGNIVASIAVTGHAVGALATHNFNANAQGNVWSYADGGEHHIAQIAKPGDWRVWAEDETGGEAYIPLAPSKRDRSEAILAEVAHRFGLGLARPMADGGALSFGDGGTASAKGGSGGPAASAKGGSGSGGPGNPRTEEQKLAAAMAKAADALIRASKGLKNLDKINAFATSLNDTIKKYFSGSKEASLLKYATGIENKMRKAAEESAKIADVLTEALQFADSTKKGLTSGSNLGSLGPLGNAHDIESGLQFRAGEMQRFADQLGALARAGVDKNMIVEIIGYGPTQGGAIADMLLKDTGTIAAINSAQGAIDAAAGRIGNDAADMMYDTGAHAADGFLTGLKGKQAALDASAEAMGAALGKEIARQLDALAKKTAQPSAGAAGVPEPKHNPKAKPPAPKPKPKKKTKKKAVGGWLDSGDYAYVGEEGPELIRMGSAPGYVHTASETAGMLGGSGDITVNLGGIHVSGTLDFADPAAADRIATQIAGAVREQLRQLDKRYT